MMIAAGRRLFGDNPLGIRLGAVLTSLFGPFVLWRTMLVLFGPGVALHAVWFALAMPLLMVGGIIITPDTPSVLFWGLTGWAMAEFHASRSRNWWLAVGLFAGLGLLSKYTNYRHAQKLALVSQLATVGRRRRCRAVQPTGCALECEPRLGLLRQTVWPRRARANFCAHLCFGIDRWLLRLGQSGLGRLCRLRHLAGSALGTAAARGALPHPSGEPASPVELLFCARPARPRAGELAGAALSRLGRLRRACRHGRRGPCAAAGANRGLGRRLCAVGPHLCACRLSSCADRQRSQPSDQGLETVRPRHRSPADCARRLLGCDLALWHYRTTGLSPASRRARGAPDRAHSLRPFATSRHRGPCLSSALRRPRPTSGAGAPDGALRFGGGAIARQPQLPRCGAGAVQHRALVGSCAGNRGAGAR
jgi:hypothetical protein